MSPSGPPDCKSSNYKVCAMERVQAQCPLHSPRSTCKPRAAGWDLGSPSLELLFYCKTCATCSLPPAGVLGAASCKLSCLFMEQKPQGFLERCEILEPCACQGEGAVPHPRTPQHVLCPRGQSGSGQRPELSTHRGPGHRAAVRVRGPGRPGCVGRGNEASGPT